MLDYTQRTDCLSRDCIESLLFNTQTNKLEYKYLSDSNVDIVTFFEPVALDLASFSPYSTCKNLASGKDVAAFLNEMKASENSDFNHVQNFQAYTPNEV